NEERAAVGSDDEVAVLQLDVMHGRVGQVLPERLPRAAVVERYVDTMLGAEIEQACSLRIFADGAGEIARCDAGDDLRPRRAVVVGLVDVGGKVVVLVAVRRHVRASGTMRRGFDEADAGEIRQVLWRDVLPGRAAIARQLYDAVVRTGPNHVRVLRRRGHREDRRVR